MRSVLPINPSLIGLLQRAPTGRDQCRQQRDAALLGDIPQRYSARFSAALAEALRAAAGDDPSRSVAGGPSTDSVRDLIMTVAVGLKHHAADREDFSTRLRAALRIILG